MTLSAKFARLDLDLTVHRVNGWFGGRGSDNPKLCHQRSTMYAYHSRVGGKIVAMGKTYEMNPSPSDTRYRVYAGSTWGCYLPFGTPPIQYPWTWLWLVIPNADPAKEIAIAGGTVRYQQYPDFGILGRDFYGGAMFVDIGDKHYSMTSARAFHNSSWELYALAAASPELGYFSTSYVNQSDWVVLKDEYGESLIPLTQTFVYRTQKLELIAQTRAKKGEIFRIAFMRELNLYSDFRANGVDAHVTLRTRSTSPDEPVEVLYEGLISSPFSAVEYAYVDPYPTTDAIRKTKLSRINYETYNQPQEATEQVGQRAQGGLDLKKPQ